MPRQGRYEISSQKMDHNLTIILKNPNSIKIIKKLSIIEDNPRSYFYLRYTYIQLGLICA